MQRITLSKPARMLVAVACGVIFLACAAYVASEVHAVLREPTEKERIARRLMPAETGYFKASEQPGFLTVYPAPDSACSAAARPELRRAEQLAADWQIDLALEPAERALAIDPDCSPAAQIVIRTHARSATHITLRRRFVGRADDEPRNAAAQLQAAYYEREAGDPEQARTYLERAQSARPTLPMLHAAWGQYFSTYADPLDYGRAIEHYEREAEQTRSLAAAWSLLRIYGEVGDLQLAKAWCDVYFERFPENTLATAANMCLWHVLRLGDRNAEKRYLERFWQARDLVEPCRHGHLAGMYLDIEGRLDDGLREADRALALGCPSYGLWPKVDALLHLRRYREAAVLAQDGELRSNFDRFRQAMALALAGASATAIRVASGSMKTRHPAGGTTVEENLERLHMLRELLDRGASKQLLETAYVGDGPLRPSEHLSWAACGYIKYGMFERGAQALERALAAKPKSAGAWACKVWLLLIEERPKEAAEVGEQALALGLRDATLEMNVGVAYTQLGECERAIPHFEQARTLTPLLVKAYGNLALCLERLGRDDEAARVRRFVLYPKAETIAWWWFAGLLVAAIALYLLAKLALIRLLPARFGHLRFP